MQKHSVFLTGLCYRSAMRLALKHQIILAPATVLLLMSLALAFLQYTYWDLSVKRQEARRLGLVFIALAEADLASQRMQGISLQLAREHFVDIRVLEEMIQLHRHLAEAIIRVKDLLILPESTRALLSQAVDDLNPEDGLNSKKLLDALSLLRPQLVSLVEMAQDRRERLRNTQTKDIDELVEHTALVSLVVLGAALLLGILLSRFFGRRILKRIQSISDSAGRIASGDLTPLTPPTRVDDELDELALSINRMTDQLIRVIGTEKLLEGAEEERRRIAMDIHDQTLSDLSSVLRGIQDMRAKNPEGGEGLRLEEDLQRAMANLREIMDNLHPQTLDILGLGAALESHLERHLSKGNLPEYHLYISPEADRAPLARLDRLNLYRIAIEAIHNVIRHAQASRYEVNLDVRNGELVLSVEDNGVGFTAPPQNGRSGRGLHNIRERAKVIGSTVQWGPSRFSTGTRFELIMPLKSHPQED
ncbi:MAG: HAMP domain-containing protein [Desulfuromonadales bacterium]